MRKQMVDFVAGITCDGDPVSSYYACIYEGTVCSDRGLCVTIDASEEEVVCVCQSGYEGDYCQLVSSDSHSDVDLGPILGSIIPSVVIALLVMACIIIGTVVWAKRRDEKENWVIDIDELEMGEQLGAGG